MYVRMYVCLSSSSSCRAISTDISDPFSPPVSIVHCFRQVFKATFPIYTELLYIVSSRSSCLCLSMWRRLQVYVTYEFVLTSSFLVRLTWIVFMMGGNWQYSWFLWGAASRTYSVLLVAFLCSCHKVFSSYV